MVTQAKHGLVVVTGGIKSGKSSWALQLGTELGARRAFVATALAMDEEIKKKIKRHRKERGSRWTTFEEARDPAGLLSQMQGQYDVVLVDCLTMWISNLLTVFHLQKTAVQRATTELMRCLRRVRQPTILVTNEVSMGILPADSMARTYLDLLSTANKAAAAMASSVFFMVAGIPQKIK